MVFTGKKAACRKVCLMLSDYIDGQLDEESQSIIERHVEVCEDCATELESLRMTVQLLHQVPSVPSPRSFTIREPDMAQKSVRKPGKAGWMRPVPVFAGAVSDKAAGIFSPGKLRWLPLATSFAAAALVLLLVLDYIQVIPFEAGGNNGAPITAVSERAEPGPLPAATGDIDGNMSQDMGNETVKVSGMDIGGSQPRGNDSFGFALPAPPEVAGKASVEGTGSDEPLLGDNNVNEEAVSGESQAQWVRQVEIGIAGLVLMLVILLLFFGRQYRKRRQV